ncbi:MmyB family transcriptional regulator, partial [Streptomyces eurythermus]
VKPVRPARHASSRTRDSSRSRTRGAARKTVDHPVVGALTLDCDILGVAGSDLRIMVYSAQPGTEDADRLALLNVIGTQSLLG